VWPPCLEKLHQDFLWGGLDDGFKLHLVNWRKICAPIQVGGLGLGVLNSYICNQYLLGKWLWRYSIEKDAPWRKVVALNCGGEEGDWCSKPVGGSHGVGLWKHIRRGCDTFSQYISFEVGYGTNVRFRQDWWCGVQPLQNAFPRLYSLAQTKDAVADCMCWKFNGTFTGLFKIRS
jgi:hypothetical protein